MNVIAEFDHTGKDPEMIVATLGAAALGCYFIWLFTQWVCRSPARPDPWDDQVAAELERDEAMALCHRCLTPHSRTVYFCPDCGAPVGECTNLMPFIQEFSIGHTLRIGSSGEYRNTPLIVAGFVLLSLVEYSVFAPFYLWRLFQNLPEPRRPKQDNPVEPSSSSV